MKRFVVTVVAAFMMLGGAAGAQTAPVTLCHFAPGVGFVTITVDDDATLGGHGNHPNDVIPAPAGGCPVDDPEPTPTVEPTPTPVVVPTATPTVVPTPTPVTEPTPVPTVEPTPVPTPEPSPTPVAAAVPAGGLPRTGTETATMAWAGVALTLCGVAVLAVRRII